MNGFESFIGINPWTALFVLLNTLTIFFVGKKFLFGPVMKMITDRQKEIDDLYEDADKDRREAAQLRSSGWRNSCELFPAAAGSTASTIFLQDTWTAC